MLLRLPRLALVLLLSAPAACNDPAPTAAEADRASNVASGAAAPAPEDAVEPSPRAAAAAAIPERFQGRWDIDEAACAGRPGEMRLTVASDRLLFHESVARVVAVRPGEAGVIAVDLALEGEGESWRETRTLRLTDGDRLEVAVRGEPALRVRCGT